MRFTRPAVLPILIVLLLAAAGAARHTSAIPPVRADVFDFETGADSNRTWPAGWERSGNQPAGGIELASPGHGGARALRLESTRHRGYLGVKRVLPDSLRPNTVAVRLSAWIRTEGVDSVSMWVGMNTYNSLTISPDSLVRWPRGDTGWTRYEFILPVLPEVERISYGVRVTGGTLWLDDVRLEALTPEQEPQSTPAARQYLEAGLDSLCRRTVLTSVLNWGVLKRAARTQMIGGKRPADAYPALYYAVRRLDDDGALGLPEKPGLVGYRQNFRLLQARDSASNVAMIRLPLCDSEDRASQLAFADTTRSVIEQMTAKHVRGWMIDLRVVEGGQLLPGLAGLGPLLGDGTLLGWARPDGVHGRITHRQGIVEATPCAPPEGTVVTVMAPDLVDTTTPVAVLIGPRTRGAGEGIALAFRNRPNTRIFGEPTGGHAYMHERVRLADGAQLRLATGTFTDAHGARLEGRMMADDSLHAALLTGGMDSLMIVALDWLRDTHSRGPNPR